MTLMFMQAYPEAVRATLLTAVGEGEVLVETQHWLIVQRKTTETASPVGFYNRGSSYNSFGLVIDLTLASDGYRAVYRVAMANNRRGQSAIDCAVEAIADELVNLVLTDAQGDELWVDLEQLANDANCESAEALRDMIVATSIVHQTTLCGRCDGTGQQPERLGGGVCPLCKGTGQERRAEAA